MKEREKVQFVNDTYTRAWVETHALPVQAFVAANEAMISCRGKCTALGRCTGL